MTQSVPALVSRPSERHIVASRTPGRLSPLWSRTLRSAGALVLSVVIGLTSLTASATPARAMDGDTFGRLLFGAAAVALAAKVYNDREDRKARERAARAAPPPAQQAAEADRWRAFGPRGRAVYGPGVRPGDRVRDADSRRVRCRRQLQTETGWVRFYSQACLDRVGADVDVPQTCLRQRWVNGRWAQYFSRGCLRRFGIVDAV